MASKRGFQLSTGDTPGKPKTNCLLLGENQGSLSSVTRSKQKNARNLQNHCLGQEKKRVC